MNQLTPSKDSSELRHYSEYLYNLLHPIHLQLLKLSTDDSSVLVITYENKNPAIHLLDIQLFVNLTKSLVTLAYCVHFYLAIALGGSSWLGKPRKRMENFSSILEKYSIFIYQLIHSFTGRIISWETMTYPALSWVQGIHWLDKKTASLPLRCF